MQNYDKDLDKIPIINNFSQHHQNFLISLEQPLKGYNVEIMKYNNTTFFQQDCTQDQLQIINKIQYYEKKIFEILLRHINTYYNKQPSEFIKMFLNEFKFNLTTIININYCLNYLSSFIRANTHNEII